MAQSKFKERLYLAQDVGGTKMQASLIGESGKIYDRFRSPTPRAGRAALLLKAIQENIHQILKTNELGPKSLQAIALAIPGVVDPASGKLVVAPNLGIRNLNLARPLRQAFRVPVVLGNDTDLGTLGECWLGAGRKAASAVGIFVGTGIGAGFVQEKRLYRGASEAALEIGHMIMQVDGPLCGCGGRGCFEALASRTAIEREIRQAVKDGQKTILTKLLEGDLKLIRSSSLRKALNKKDRLVMKIVSQAARIHGLACLNIRHLFDPEVIIMGGGVLEACHEFMLPIIQETVAQDPLRGARAGAKVVLSKLGDDAVVLGAVAQARMAVGRSPF